MLAARLDLAPGLLPSALPLLRQGLQDPDDDVRAACADALVPVAGALHHAGPQVGVLDGAFVMCAAPGLRVPVAGALHPAVPQVHGRLWTGMRHVGRPARGCTPRGRKWDTPRCRRAGMGRG